MKKSILTVVIIILFSITGCKDPDPSPDLEGNFWAVNTITNQYYRVDAEKLAETALCEVWVERGSASQSTAQLIANEYNIIYSRMMDAFGSSVIYNSRSWSVMELAHWIATGKTNGKLTILLLDIKDSYAPSSNKAFLAGYFYPEDMLDNISTTNKRDMLYIDTNPGLIEGMPHIYNTIAHEMQHLMNFVNSIACRTSGSTIYTMDTWIDEGLSSAAEWVYSEKHGSRVDYYNNGTGLIAKGNNFFVWDNRKYEHTNALLDDYSTVYLFFQWLRIHKSTSIYKNIISSSSSNHVAVTSAFGKSWEDILRDWLAANYIQSSAGSYGYEGEISLTTHYAPTGSSNISLFPGEGVYSSATSYLVPPQSGSIKYAGLNTGLVSSGTITGTLLTYNANDNNGGGSELGTVTNASVGIMNKFSAGQSSTPKGPFPIGINDALRRNGYNGDFNTFNFTR